MSLKQKHVLWNKLGNKPDDLKRYKHAVFVF